MYSLYSVEYRFKRGLSLRFKRMCFGRFFSFEKLNYLTFYKSKFYLYNDYK